MHIRVDILSDTVCPWCYIGKRRFETALTAAGPEFEADVRWHPFQLNPDMPPEGMDRGHYIALKFGGAERGRHIYRHVAEAARSSGLDMQLERISRTPNTVDSHRLLAHAARAGLQNEVVEGLFAAYFLEGRDIGAIEVLTDVAAAAGLERKEVELYLRGDRDRKHVVESDARARRSGVSGVPHFVIEEEFAVAGAQEPEVFRNVLAAMQARAGSPA